MTLKGSVSTTPSPLNSSCLSTHADLPVIPLALQVHDNYTTILSMPKLLPLKSFIMDADDSYHFLLAELVPAELEALPGVDLGDLNHPSISRSLCNSGLFSTEEVLASAGPHPKAGPLYTPDEAVDLALLVSESLKPNWRGLRVPVKSHLNLKALEFLLKDYSDPWILRGSTYGWPLSRDPALHLSGVTWPNHDSCNRHMAQVNEFFWDEVNHGAIFPLGPAPVKIPPPISTIPLLCVPKPPSLTKVRVCGDMSFPAGSSVNDGISTDTYEGEPFRCRLPSIWDFLAQVKEIGLEDAVIAKADFSRGYRQVPIDPGDWLKQMFQLPQLGFALDTRAVFGGRPCCSMMQRTHQALAWAGINTAVSIDQAELELSRNPLLSSHRSCSPYVDDSLLAAHRACSSSVWANLLAVFEATNIQLSTTEGHICPPSRSMRALGFDVDLDSVSVSIPRHKLDEMIEFVQMILSKDSVSRHEIKRLLGRICRCIMIIREGRRFIGRLLLLLQGPPLPAHVPVPLPVGAKEDLLWWLRHGPQLNHKTLITLTNLPLTSVFLVDGRGSSKDLPPSVGGLCYHTCQFFSMVVPEQFYQVPVHVIEAIALLAASRLWVPLLPGGNLIPIGSDNQAVVAAFQFGRAKDQYLAAMARLLWGVFATSSCSFQLRYVKSEKNSSDGVSRLDRRHINFLTSQGWQRLHLPEAYFSLDESDPFLYQVEIPGTCKQDAFCSSSSPLQPAPNTQDSVNVEPL